MSDTKGKGMLKRTFQLIVIFVLSGAPLRLAGQDAQNDVHFGPSGQTALALSEQGTIEILINGQGPFELFYDTGAAVNILNPEVISKLSLPASNFSGDIWGISGRPIDSKPFHTRELRIGDLTLTDQNFFNVPIPGGKRQHVVGAIGYELFRRVIVTADYEHHQLTLCDPAHFFYSGTGLKLELLPDPKHLVARARVGKAYGNFVLDTGDLGQVGISFRNWFVFQQHLDRPFVRRYHGVFAVGADGKGAPSTNERIHPVCLGTTCISHLVGELSSANADTAYAGVIGLEILGRFISTVDWQHHAFYIERASRWDRPLVYDQTGLLTDFADTGTALVVTEVLTHSPASRAHLKAGDRILLIDRHPPDPTLVADDQAFLQPAGTHVMLTIQRGETTLHIPIILKDIL